MILKLFQLRRLSTWQRRKLNSFSIMLLAFPLLSSFPFLFRFLLQVLKLSGLLIVGLFFSCNTHSERDGGKQGRERITEVLFSSAMCPKRLCICYYINDNNTIHCCKYSLRDLLHATNLISVNREVGKDVTPASAGVSQLQHNTLWIHQEDWKTGRGHQVHSLGH